MKKLGYFTIILFFLVSCQKTEINNYTKPTKPSIPTQAFLNGSFVDFWNKSNWSVQQWEDHLNEMKQIGLETLIIQSTVYIGNGSNVIWCLSWNNYSKDEYPEVLNRFLYAADHVGMQVYVGLYLNEDTFNWQTFHNGNNDEVNIEALNEIAQRTNNLARDIQQAYAWHPSFVGWYISEESAPSYTSTNGILNHTKFEKLKNNLYIPVTNKLKSFDDKKIAISVYFNTTLTSPNNMIFFMKEMADCQFDIIMLQDGTGASDDGITPHCPIDKLQNYFNAAKSGLYDEANFQGNFWADTELFKPSNYPYDPDSFDNVKQKLDTVAPYVTQIVSWQYYKYMSSVTDYTGYQNGLAYDLRINYTNYYNLHH